MLRWLKSTQFSLEPLWFNKSRIDCNFVNTLHKNTHLVYVVSILIWDINRWTLQNAFGLWIILYRQGTRNLGLLLTANIINNQSWCWYASLINGSIHESTTDVMIPFPYWMNNSWLSKTIDMTRVRNEFFRNFSEQKYCPKSSLV